VCDGRKRGGCKISRGEGGFVSQATGYTNHATVQCIAAASLVFSGAWSRCRRSTARSSRLSSGGLATTHTDLSECLAASQNSSQCVVSVTETPVHTA
jgi:hypothetical protein